MFAGILKRLRNIADEHADKFESEGFKAFFTMLKMELSDEYLATVQMHLTALKFPHGALLSADLGIGNASSNHLLRKARDEGSWLARILGRSPPGYTFRLHPRDQAGPRILSEMQDRGINLVANALGQSADHVLSFFVVLRTELAFYIGCLNLHDRLVTMGEPICFPRPEPVGERRLRFTELYDVCLALTVGRRVVGNALNADRKSLMVITGPNTGGKSTFLRSLGLAQLMMHCGMFVGAHSFDAELCGGLFTHYKREEDPTMKSGKFDEELSRMSDITDKLAPESMLLFNESFSATNEREGSEIAKQIVCALLEKRIRVFFVTHLYEFARGFFDRKTEDAIFLRAQRLADGTRTFKVVEGKPLETSYGEDLYNRIFGTNNRA
jgi:DNA mismatch repair ATPase MutS